MKKYQIIYADPPWAFRTYSKPLDGKHFRPDDTGWRNADIHYPCMQLEDIKRLPVATLAADNCVLFLWVTAPCLEQGLQVIKAWGFTYKTKAFCWVKENKSGTPFIGMGYWSRSNSEDCLLATRGKPHRQRADISQIIQSQREKHSRKPDIVRDRIVSLMGDLPRIELFARQKVDGWDAWGNEVESDMDFSDYDSLGERLR